MTIDTDKALAVLRERAVAALLAWGDTDINPEGRVALDALLALNAAVAMANATYHVHPDGCDHSEGDGDTHKTKWCTAYQAVAPEADRLAREALEEAT